MTVTGLTVEVGGLGSNRALSSLARRRITTALARLAVRPVAAQVAFVDDDGPKGGPAVRCALTLRVPYRPAVRVEDTAMTARTAFDGAFAALERRLARYVERDRERRRRPKKYYVAKRLMTGESPAERS
jgi:ribosome-associated translation inhibitor RaiA